MPKGQEQDMTKFIRQLGVVLALFASVVFGADNSIYIDQSGSSTTIDITQTGAGNVVRGIQTGNGNVNTVRAKLYGTSADFDITQIGSDNLLSLGVNTSIATGYAYGIDLSYYVSGNNATAVINSNNAGTGTSGSNWINISQTGNTAGINLNILGSKNNFTATTTGGASNIITATISGDLINNTIAVSGGGSNGITLTQSSSNADNIMTMVGASNTLSLTQSGVAGVNGHGFTLNLTGSSNSLTTTQSGTIDTTVNLLSTGSGNTWNITTGN